MTNNVQDIPTLGGNISCLERTDILRALLYVWNFAELILFDGEYHPCEKSMYYYCLTAFQALNFPLDILKPRPYGGNV